MAQDRRGQPLRPGDLVTVPCRVTGVDPPGVTEYSNITVETIEPMYPGTTKTLIPLNSKQVDLVSPTGRSNPEMDVQKAIDDSRIVNP